MARALELSPAEHRYLFTLAGIIPAAETVPQREQLPPHVQRLLESVEPNIGYAIGRRWDILGANQTARLVLPMFNIPLAPVSYSLAHNLAYQMFTNPHAVRVIGAWEQHARRIVHDLRLDYSQAADDTQFTVLIQRLRDESSQFCAWWDDQSVGLAGVVRKDVHHPVVGVLSFEQRVYRLLNHPGIKTIFYVPLTMETQHKIERLRAAQERD